MPLTPVIIHRRLSRLSVRGVVSGQFGGTPALLAALHAGRIGGAGLDVYDTEPLPADDPLRSAPRTVLTPHLGYVSDRAYRVFCPDAVADVAAFLAGKPIRVIE